MMSRLFLNDFVNCDRCGLSSETHVPGRGSPIARIMLVGEAPGSNEALLGFPFVGRAGKLLTQMLIEAEINPDEVYITNIVRCRPPANRTPTKGEMASCRPWLERELALIKPRVIVTLGNTPTAAFEIDEKISKARGRLFEINGLRILPTFHPAYLLRNECKISLVISDFKQSLLSIQL